MSSPVSPITRVIGVYDAEGTLRGEIAYLLRRTFTGRHCALCDITHGAVKKRSSWEQCSVEFSARHKVDVHLAHLDDAPRPVLEHEDFRAPAVYLERLDGSVEPLMTAEDLEKCETSPEIFFALLEEALEQSR
ncbi:MAG: hypothetical protein ACO3SP_03410 [Ilumatobacteraceae bacterium]